MYSALSLPPSLSPSLSFSFTFLSYVISPPQNPPAPYKTKYGTNPPVENHVGWMISKRVNELRTQTDSYGSSPGTSELGTSPVAHSIPTFQHPSHSLLKSNGFLQQRYDKYRSFCLRGM